MDLSKVSVRTAIAVLASGLVQACTALPEKSVAGEGSFSEEVTTEMYTRYVYLTGSRIPRKVDLRRSVEDQSPAPLKVVRVAK
jgi:hypothetical protein